MVDKSHLVDLVTEYFNFYSHVVKLSKLAGDKERATYGVEVAGHLLAFLEKKDSFKNQDLKLIHGSLADLTRGVEYFEDFETQLKMDELGKKLYPVERALATAIKW